MVRVEKGGKHRRDTNLHGKKKPQTSDRPQEQTNREKKKTKHRNATQNFGVFI